MLFDKGIGVGRLFLKDVGFLNGTALSFELFFATLFETEFFDFGRRLFNEGMIEGFAVRKSVLDFVELEFNARAEFDKLDRLLLID